MAYPPDVQALVDRAFESWCCACSMKYRADASFHAAKEAHDLARAAIEQYREDQAVADRAVADYLRSVG